MASTDMLDISGCTCRQLALQCPVCSSRTPSANWPAAEPAKRVPQEQWLLALTLHQDVLLQGARSGAEGAGPCPKSLPGLQPGHRTQTGGEGRCNNQSSVSTRIQRDLWASHLEALRTGASLGSPLHSRRTSHYSGTTQELGGSVQGDLWLYRSAVRLWCYSGVKTSQKNVLILTEDIGKDCFNAFPLFF